MEKSTRDSRVGPMDLLALNQLKYYFHWYHPSNCVEKETRWQCLSSISICTVCFYKGYEIQTDSGRRIARLRVSKHHSSTILYLSDTLTTIQHRKLPTTCNIHSASWLTNKARQYCRAVALQNGTSQLPLESIFCRARQIIFEQDKLLGIVT